MQITLLVTLVLHILSGVFWAGSTFALARTGAATADQLFRPQIGAAVAPAITRGALWHLLHPPRFSPIEQPPAPRAPGAVLAPGGQGALRGPALRPLAS